MLRALLSTVALASVFAVANDNATYTAKIKEYTTEPFFLTELVDHLPASDTVPSPDKVLGYVIGTPNKLTYSADCARYLRELDAASDRVKVFSMGRSEEGREMVVAVITDEANMARLDHFKDITRKLGNPRGLADAEPLIKEGLPFYWATGAMHSTESGSPEMIMELAFRLAVEETPFIETIRKNSFVMLTPVLETDGRDRYVDTYYYRKQNPDKPAIPLVYWGKYVAHDNNRDGMAISLAMSKNLMKTWFEYHPQVLHDLHESVPYLYISTGTGPYNSWLDPITIDEWHIMAYHEVNEMTRRGVPGVWTHGFYDGWAPNYAFYAANGHNAIGRFYETFGGGGADTGIRNAGSTNREWFRPNPPFSSVRWSIRNNINMQQSALLLGLNNIAANKEKFLRNYHAKSVRSIAKARTEGPAAYVLPATETRTGQQAKLIEMLRRQGIEIHRLTKAVETKDGKFPSGSLVVRMDQPYSRMADMLLDKQFYSPSDPSPYDDTGWTLGPLFNVETIRCTDVKVLDAPMEDTAGKAMSATIAAPAGAKAVVFPNSGDLSLARLRYLVPDKISYAKEEFSYKGKKWPAGTVIAEGDVGRLVSNLADAGISGAVAGDVPKFSARATSPARIALIHTWTNTQDEGWYRLAFDDLKIPYAYKSLHEIRDTSNLKSKYDVIVLPPSTSAMNWLNGRQGSDAIPWKALPGFPNLGGPDTSDDIRGGIDLEGVINLRNFVKEGGLLIAIGSSCEIPINFGLTNGVSIVRTTALNAPGGVFRVINAGGDSPVAAGYQERFGVYFDQSPVLSAGGGGGFGGGGGGQGAGGTRRGGPGERDIVQGRPPYEPKKVEGDVDQQGFGGQSGLTPPKVLLRFAPENELLISGMLDGGSELAGRAALVDSKLGKGHILLFGINPMWRMQTHGSYMLMFNSIMTWNDMD